MARDYITALKLSLFVLSIALFLFMSFSAWKLLTGTSMELLSYLNIASKHPMQEILPLDITLLRLNGGMHGIAALILFISIIKLDIFSNKDCFQPVKWGLFITLFSFVLLGSIFCIISNQQGAALFFFASSVIYLLLRWGHSQEGFYTHGLWNYIMYLPVYLMILYTMGIPGYEKLFHMETVLPKYVDMFHGSFISKLPGGTTSMILLIGIFEQTVVVLLFVSILKGEFLISEPKPWFKIALLLCIIIFSMLCFGLTVVGNYQGAMNLLFYATFTFLLLASLGFPRMKCTAIEDHY